jgi:hypothetical protein
MKQPMPKPTQRTRPCRRCSGSGKEDLDTWLDELLDRIESTTTEKITTGAGYVFVKRPDHPGCNARGYVLEHRLVMEEKLGRYLTREEVVHHVNHNKSDNRIENLDLISTASEHTGMHSVGRVKNRSDRQRKDAAGAVDRILALRRSLKERIKNSEYPHHRCDRCGGSGKEEASEQAEAIINFLRANPGSTHHEITIGTDMPYMTAYYHLRILLTGLAVAKVSCRTGAEYTFVPI